MMKELAYRLAAPYRDNMFSLMHKPWFDFSIYHHFQPTDFTPVPSVDVVMLRFTKRKNPLLPWNEKTNYQKFIQAGFANGLPVYRNLKQKYGHKKVLQAFYTSQINRNAKPSQLSLQQWISLYKEVLRY